MTNNNDGCACLGGSCPPCMGRCRCVFQKDEPRVSPAAITGGAFSAGLVVAALLVLFRKRLAGLFRRRPAVPA